MKIGDRRTPVFTRRAFLTGWFSVALNRLWKGSPLVVFQMHNRELTDRSGGRSTITIFLCGDVMTGRGIDQILPYPSDPGLYEENLTSALDYVALAEERVGSISRPVGFSYIWGDAIAEWDRVQPDARIINLETCITASDEPEPKGINYRMNPANTPCLTAAKVDCCVLANNHVLDWGVGGLHETLDTLSANGLKSAGAGRDLAEAAAPAIIEVGDNRRIIVFSFGTETSGIPMDWGATLKRPGVNLIRDLSDETLIRIAASVRAIKRSGDIVVASIHWGGNWGYDIPRNQRRFARGLVDQADVDIIHGHSSHHPKAIEVYRNKPILYSCGDYLNDYEGIVGYERFRDDLALMYFVTLDAATGELVQIVMTPLQIRKFRLNHVSRADAEWLRDVLNREGARFGTGTEFGDGNRLQLLWEHGGE